MAPWPSSHKAASSLSRWRSWFNPAEEEKMIERLNLDGRLATVAYLKGDFEPADK
jgi:hypothetical protein